MEPLQILERYFNAFIGKDDAKDFFLGLGDYLDYAVTLPEVDFITTQIAGQATPLYEKLAQQEKAAIEKLDKARDEIAQYVAEQQMVSGTIDEAFREYDDFKNVRTLSSAPMPQSLHEELFDVLQVLHRIPAHREFASRYIEFADAEKKRLRRYLPIQEVDDFLETKEDIKRGRESAVWGAQAQLFERYEVMRQGRETRKKLIAEHREKGFSASWALLNYGAVLGEWNAIQEGNDHRPVIFVVAQIRPAAQRFHTYILAHFAKAKEAVAKAEEEAYQDDLLSIEEVPDAPTVTLLEATHEVRDKLPYFRDYEIFAFWQYLNGHMAGRSVFQIRDLTAPNASALLVMQFLLAHFQLWGVTLEQPVFHKKHYLDFNKTGYEKLQNRLAKIKSAAVKKAISNIFKNDFGVADLKDALLPLQSSGVLEYIEFGKELSEKNREEVASFLDAYIDAFIHDNLDLRDANFYSFEKQRQITEQELEEHREKFGSRFILKHLAEDTELDPTKRDPYLFVHSLIALEKLGRIKVEEIWIDDDIAPELQVNDYKIKLTLIDAPAPDEAEQSQTPKMNTRKPALTAEGKQGYLKFYKEGKRIPIGKVSTRKYRLLQSLIDAPGVAKSVEVVFAQIKLPRDAQDGVLNQDYLALGRMREIIDFTMKDLQKIPGLKGRIALVYHFNGKSVALKVS